MELQARIVVMVALMWLACGCVIDTSVDKRDGWPDALSDTGGDNVELDVPADDGATGDVSETECGNGEKEGDEECDDGDDNSDTEPDACRTDCTLPRCGDDVRDAGEACDDGDTDNSDFCTTECQPARCGDGYVYEGVEECDDGNESNEDACINSCEVASCGDGFIYGGEEECDNGGANSDTLRDACRENCMNPHCGDGVTDSGEACDDGNFIETDECTSACRAPGCGDGEVQGEEECDDGNEDNTDGCLDTCVVATCGDGFVRAGEEECDDGNHKSTDGCLDTCVVATCGDGFVWTGNEECDDGDDNSDTEPDACRTDCKRAHCGDGILDSGESCDDGNTIDTDECPNDCSLATCGDCTKDPGEDCDDCNTDNTDGCLSTCVAATCGDGFVWNGHEQCDGDPPRACDTICETTGVQRCIACEWGECEPPLETCNGVDDDCDDDVDETFDCVRGENVECTTGCGSIGLRVCDSTCSLSGECSPPLETCNGVDDDCDDDVDEDFDCEQGAADIACTTTCGSTGTGTCTATCELPSAEDCTPPVEACNGVDDDCDDDVDEDFDCVKGTLTSCTTTCGSSGWAECTEECAVPGTGACTPPPEMCNGVDDDCDDDVDEGGGWTTTTRMQLSDAGEANGRLSLPSIAWTGSEYGVVWEDGREASGDEIWFASTDGSGSIVTDESKVTTSPDDALQPSLMWGSLTYGLVWSDPDGGAAAAVQFARLDTTGNLMGTVTEVASGSADLWRPVLAPRLGGYMVAWDSEVTVSISRLDGLGAVVGSNVDITDDPAASIDPDIAWTGSSYAVFWVDERDVGGEIYCAMVDDDGFVLTPPKRLTEGTNPSYSPSVVWDGRSFTVAWDMGPPATREIFLARVNEACSRIADDVEVTTTTVGSAEEPVLSWTGSILGLVWVDNPAGLEHEHIMFQPLDPLGVPLFVESAVSDTGHTSVEPDITWSGSEFGIAWSQEVDGGDHVWEVYLATMGETSCP